MRAFTRSLLFLTTLLFSSGLLASPADTVEAYHDKLLQAVDENKDAPDQRRYEQFAPAMDAAFDFEGMIKTAAGRHWSKAAPETRDALVAAFRRVSIATYADQFRDLAGGEFVVRETRDGPRGLKLVESQLKTGSENVTLTYVVRDKDGEWRIIDVLLKGGISELALRASEYAGTLEKGGAKALTKALDEQAARLLEN